MSHYIHGTSSEEQQRLTLLNTILLNQACLRELALQGGEKILDVGSGLGQFSRVMAKQAGTVVLGIERSKEQLDEALQQAESAREENLIEFRQGDARQLPLNEKEWGSFDVAFTRFLLEHVPDPLNVVKQMVSAVKKGGRIVLADDDHEIFRMHPDISGFAALWKTYMRSYVKSGNDPFIGKKLTTLLYQSGARPIHNTWIFFGSCSGDKHFDIYVDNLIGVLAGAREQIVQQAMFKSEKFDRIIGSFRDWRRRADAALWYAVCWAEGIK
jgi:ubiquinone/menaquinone biosynthesis C-methylase UbiE